MIGVDLFCGAGGMSLGAVQAGIEVVLAVEDDRHAVATYSANHPLTSVLVSDIRRLTRHRLRQALSRRRVDVVFGGPPCQGFSYSNLRTRSAENSENWLFREFLRVVRLLQPPWVLFENVRGLVNTASGVFFKQVTRGLIRAGYTISHAVPNARHFGVPQDRARLFICGSRNGTAVALPTTSHRKTVTVREAIQDLPLLSVGAGVDWLEYARVRPSRYARRLRNGQPGCHNHLVSANSRRVVARYAHIPQGGNWEDIPPRLMRNYEDRTRCHTGIYHRLREDQPSIVIGNYRKNMLIHPTEDRGLSVREAARLQSFPDSYVFHGSIGFQQQQVGNAVPPQLAYYVFRSLIRQAS